MPIYEYRCLGCNRIFQKLQSMGSSAAGVTCPDCGCERVERQLSTFASGQSTGSSASGHSPSPGCAHSGGG